MSNMATTVSIDPAQLERLVTRWEQRTGVPVRRTPHDTAALFLDTLDALGYVIVRSRTRNVALDADATATIEAAMGATPRAANRRARFKAGVTVPAFVAALAADSYATVAPGALD